MRIVYQKRDERGYVEVASQYRATLQYEGDWFTVTPPGRNCWGSRSDAKEAVEMAIENMPSGWHPADLYHVFPVT